MGKLGRSLVEFLRAGALATGAGFLLGLWVQGLASLGLRGSYPDGLPDFLMVAIAGVALAAWLGFPSGAGSVLRLLGRIAGTFVCGVALTAAIGGIVMLLVKAGVRESSLPLFFLPVGAALVAVGLRRLPRAGAARIALGAVVALLATMRLLAVWPAGAHVVTRRLFPLPLATIRSELDRYGWGPMASDDRTKIVAFDSKVKYWTEFSHLVSDVDMKFALEVQKPFFEDACLYVHSSQPIVPPGVRAYASKAACDKEHPPKERHHFEHDYEPPSPCCLFEVKERHPGERIETSRTWTFTFHRLKWEARM